ncbi:MAG: HAD-IB family phosphatase [Thermoplasmata archaeon]
MVYRLLIFDLDGTLVDIESSWSWVHKHYSVNNDQALNQFLNGIIDDEEFMRRDISLWLSKKGRIHISEIEEILSKVPLKKGATELFDFLRKEKVYIAIASGGIDLLANRVGRALGIHEVLANGLETDKNGFLTGRGILRVKLLEKDVAVKEIARRLNIRKSEIISIGNSFIDCQMFRVSGYGIAFSPVDEEVCRDADLVVKSTDMKALIPVLEPLI